VEKMDKNVQPNHKVKLNASPRGPKDKAFHFFSFLSKSDVLNLAKLYEADFEAFGYEFQSYLDVAGAGEEEEPDWLQMYCKPHGLKDCQS